MPAAGVELQVQAQIDHLDAYRRITRSAVDGRDQLWDMVDLAQDEAYENRVKGQTISDLDDVLDESEFGNNADVRNWFTLHNQYYNTDAPIVGVTTVDTALLFYLWRAGEDFNDWHNLAINGLLTPAAVFPSPLTVLGDFVRTAGVFTDGVAIDPLRTGEGRVRAVATSIIGASTWDVTATLARSDATTEVLTVQFQISDGVGTEYVYGEQALTGDCLTGSATCLIAATGQFEVGSAVLLSDDSGDSHYSTIASISAGVNIILDDVVRFDFTTANSSVVTPLFADVTTVTDAASGTAGDTCDLNFKPDRDTVVV